MVDADDSGPAVALLKLGVTTVNDKRSMINLMRLPSLYCHHDDRVEDLCEAGRTRKSMGKKKRVGD